MAVFSEDKIRIIFGLKVSQQRAKLGLSLSKLSAKSGLSASYLNEIEKGKKYPKAEKISALAAALKMDYDELVSLKLKNDLAPLGELLSAPFFDEIPFALFGIEGNNIIDLIAKSPLQASSFLGAFIDLARQYNISESTFHTASLRCYQELLNNYFPEIEKAVEKCASKFQLNPKNEDFIKNLETVLIQEYSYKIDRQSLDKNPVLKGVKSYYSNEKGNTLFLESGLSPFQQLFLLAKEIGFNYFVNTTEPRVNTIGGRAEISGFQQLMENFSASYFAGALLLPEKPLVAEISQWLEQEKWDANFLISLAASWKCTPETLMHRLTNLLPNTFGLDTMFFLKFNKTESGKQPFLERELHLNRKHLPHANTMGAHYCNRWVGLKTLEEAFASPTNEVVCQAQISDFKNSEDQFVVISMARKISNEPKLATSTSIGVHNNKKSSNKIKWLTDANLPRVSVNLLCENCDIENCEERAAAPIFVQKRAQRALIRKELAELT